MNETYLSWVLSGLAVLIAGTIKNDKSKAKFKKVLLQVYRAIKAIYATDPDFE